MASDENFATLRFLNLGFGVQETEPSRPLIAEADGSRRCDSMRIAAGAGEVSEEVVQDESAVSAVEMTRRTFVGSAELKIDMCPGRTVVLDNQRGRDWVAWPDGDVSPRNVLTILGKADTECAVELDAA